MSDEKPIPMLIYCSLTDKDGARCGARHIDEGEFATRPHKTHTCQRCGGHFALSLVPTVGVEFLPGCKSDEPHARELRKEETVASIYDSQARLRELALRLLSEGSNVTTPELREIADGLITALNRVATLRASLNETGAVFKEITDELKRRNDLHDEAESQIETITSLLATVMTSGQDEMIDSVKEVGNLVQRVLKAELAAEQLSTELDRSRALMNEALSRKPIVQDSKPFDVEAVQKRVVELQCTMIDRIFRHHKGGRYRVWTVSADEATGAILVTYRSLDSYYYWTRTLENFIEPVTKTETVTATVPRFVIE